MFRDIARVIGMSPQILRNLLIEKGHLINKEDYPSLKFAMPGDYYSPIPSIQEIKLNEGRIWPTFLETIPAINLNEDKQLCYLQEFKDIFYKDLPFTDKPNQKLRYYYENDWYSYADAIILYCMMRKIQPRQIIEVGAGYSSAVMMDVNELFFDTRIKITFIEPYAHRLLSLMKKSDRNQYFIIEKNLQCVDLNAFQTLDSNDILFVDSSHVAKIDSDVNYLIFQILPSLRKGVFIHFHDVFFPFEYPMEWIYEGRAWNEAYLLRSFLQYNESFEIVYWNDYLNRSHREEVAKAMPLNLKNTGSSIWLTKLHD
jgi:predicted O-methyltransferase YrrM